LVALDRYDEALERFNQLRELDPEDFDLYEEYSGALLSAGRPEEALEWLNRAVSLSLNGQFLLGAIYSNLEAFDRAVNVYKHIVKQHPGQLKGWRSLADAATWSKDYRLGIHIYKQLLDRAPKDESLQIALANAYLWSGQHQRALDMYVEILNRSPDRYDLWVSLMNAAAGEDVEIGPAATRLLGRIAATRENWPDNANFKRGMADALFRFGEDRRAMSLLRELLRENPTNIEVQRQVGDSLHRHGRYKEAEQIYDSLLKRGTPDRSSQPRTRSGTRNVTLQKTP
jgi:tetratricopeptide (TPR) repeat protein